MFLFYLGMLISKHNIFKNITLKKALIFMLTGLLLVIIWWRFECYNKFAIDMALPFGAGFNPPSITSTVMALFMLILACGIFSTVKYIKWLSWITTFISWIGKHTLYIFLYHRFFLDYILSRWVNIENMWLIRGIYLVTMIFGSILIEYLLYWGKQLICGRKSRNIKWDERGIT